MLVDEASDDPASPQMYHSSAVPVSLIGSERTCSITETTFRSVLALISTGTWTHEARGPRETPQGGAGRGGSSVAIEMAATPPGAHDAGELSRVGHGRIVQPCIVQGRAGAAGGTPLRLTAIRCSG